MTVHPIKVWHGNCPLIIAELCIMLNRYDYCIMEFHGPSWSLRTGYLNINLNVELHALQHFNSDN